MPPTNQRLTQGFYTRPTEQVARSLLGKTLVHQLPDGQRLSGVIVEVEAYLAEGDLASHSARGLNRKNASMFQTPGTLYVYPIHAKHCLNVVTEEAGQGAAVLIRGLEPLEGQQRMPELRGLEKSSANPSTGELDLKTAIRLTSGPARLCQALAMDRCHDGLDLLDSSEVWIEDDEQFRLHDLPIRYGERIGISQSRDLPLRMYFDGQYFVSGLARDHTQGRHWSFRH